MYKTLADEGRAPSVRELAEQSSNSGATTLNYLAELTDAHALVI
ncbi:hypothetical protein [Corynebacterium deserti]|nr:hypothetical protein [Corynebacterium deserti]